MGKTTHGLTNHPLYGTWRQMKRRCYDKKEIGYANYGGRGIRVCGRWLESFAHFLSDMGERPEKMDLDRIDNDGDYGPDNCRWSTRSENLRNRRQPSECRNGHAYNLANTYHWNGQRRCRECHRLNARLQNRRRQSAGLPAL